MNNSNDWVSTYSLYNSMSLSHHGIDGQKWGVRNGPPYPLDYNSHSAKEKRKNSKSELSKNNKKKYKVKNDSLINDNKDKKISGYKNYDSDNLKVNEINRDLLSKNPNAAVVNPDIIKKNFFKDHKKELIIAGSAILAAALIGGGVYLVKSGKYDKIINSGREAVSNIFKNKPPSIPASKDPSAQEKFIKSWLLADVHRYDPITMDEYKSLGDDSFTLKSGQQFFRMAQEKFPSFRKGIEYVSYGDDRERYKAFLPQMWNANRGGGLKNFYEYTAHSTEDIKVPSKKMCIDILTEIYKQIGDSTPFDTALKNFNKDMAYLIDRNGSMSKMFIQSLRNMGFNAVVDYNDAGRLADNPLIIFSGSGSLSLDDVTSVGKEEAFQLFKSIKLPTSRQDFSIDAYNKEIDIMRKMLVGAYIRQY